jgi:hypothetical protein
MGAKSLGSAGLAVLVCDDCGNRSRPVKPLDQDAGRVIRVPGWQHVDDQVRCPDCDPSPKPQHKPSLIPSALLARLQDLCEKTGTRYSPPRTLEQAQRRIANLEFRALATVRQIANEPAQPKGNPRGKRPTEKQIAFLKSLCRQAGVPYTTPPTKHHASKRIDKLLKRVERGGKRRRPARPP